MNPGDIVGTSADGLFRLDAVTGVVTPLARPSDRPSDYWDIDVAPDGSVVALAASYSAEVHRIDTTTGAVTSLWSSQGPGYGAGGTVSVAPNGDVIVSINQLGVSDPSDPLSALSALFRLDAATGAMNPLPQPFGQHTFYWGVSVGADGSIVESACDSFDLGIYKNEAPTQVFRMDAATGAITSLASIGTVKGGPIAVAPNGDIALLATPYGAYKTEFDELWRIDATTGVGTPLPQPFGQETWYHDVAVEPDGSIVVSGRGSASSGIARIDATTGATTLLSSISQGLIAAAPGGTDLALTSLAWDTTQDGVGVKFNLDVSGSDTPAATTYGLYWATGPTFDDVIGPIQSDGATLSWTVDKGMKAGSIGQTIPRSALGTPPKGAKDLLAVADPPDPAHPKGQVTEAHEDNNVMGLALPDLRVSMAWNLDRDGTPKNFYHRGVDFAYTIADAALPKRADIAFYYAKGPAFEEQNLIGGPLVDRPLDDLGIGTHARSHSDRETGAEFNKFNEAARFPEPPSDALYLLIVADPDNKIVKAGDDYKDEKNVYALRLFSKAEILNNSVEAAPVSNIHEIQIKFSFVPGHGSGAAIPLSEAEVVLGVDHFNWEQTLLVPGNWGAELWQDVQTPDGELDRSSFDPRTLTYTGLHPRAGQPIERTTLPPGFYDDPVVQNIRGHVVTRVYRVSKGGTGDFLYLTIPIRSDAFPYYLDELGEVRGYGGVGGTKTAFQLDLLDAPLVPYYGLSIADPSQRIDLYPTDKDFMEFRTQLVGVDVFGTEIPLDFPGLRYSWKSNSTYDPASVDKTYHSGGLTLPVPIGVLVDPPGFSATVVGGGVFDVRRDDDTPVPGFPTDPPPVIPRAPAGVPSVLVNDGSAQRSMVNSLTVRFGAPVTLGPGAIEVRGPDGTTVGLDVATSLDGGQTVAVITFVGPDVIGGSLADGRYTLTVHGDRIYDGIGQAVDGDGDGVAGGDRVDALFRLFGDTDGDGDVDNNAPVLDPIADQAVTVGQTVSFTARATDPELGQVLTFSLDPGAPAGATIDPRTGAFTWTPADGPSSVTITVRVTDNGSPQLSYARSFTVTIADSGGSVVTPPPAFAGVQRLYAGKGRRRKVVGFQINFSAPLDAGAAQTVGHYQVTQPGLTRRSKAKVMPVRAAQYNPGGTSVTLILGKYNLRKPLTLMATGLVGAKGTPMPAFTTRL